MAKVGKLNVGLTKVSLAQGRNLVGKAVYENFNKEWPKKLKLVLPSLQGYIRSKLLLSETYYSLTEGTLKGEFGLGEEANSEVSQIVNIIAESLKIRFNRFKFVFPRLTGGLVIYIDLNIYRDLLNSSFSYVSEKSGSEIKWLEWLLIKGDEIIIQNYHVLFGEFDQSRSGMAIMFKNGVYQVSPNYSGTFNDNWITRELGDNETESAIGYIIHQELF